MASAISRVNRIGGAIGLGSLPKMYPKSMWNKFPVGNIMMLSKCLSPMPNCGHQTKRRNRVVVISAAQRAAGPRGKWVVLSCDDRILIVILFCAYMRQATHSNQTIAKQVPK